MPEDASGHPDVPRVIAPSGAVLADVGDAILRRELRSGVEAPNEAELSKELRISRSSARRALSALGAVGILTEAEPVPEVDGEAHRELAETAVGGIGRLLRLVLLDRRAFGNAEVLGVRTALERAAAAGAARTADETDLAELTSIVERMHGPAITSDEFRYLDTAFHLRIARASGNGLQERLLHGLTDAIASHMQHAFSAVYDWPATARRLADEHERLVAVIRRRRSTEAAEFVAAHVHNFYAHC
jgi:GntR family transcriptional repressor for pyruvate dehydrogenase complex